MAQVRVSGACQRCGGKFAADQRVTIVRERIGFGFMPSANMYVGATTEWVAVCAACATPAEAAEAEHELNCRGCGQPMATPHPHYSFEAEDGATYGRLRYKVCSDRCAQRWRRHRQAEGQPLATCETCKTAFRPTRKDARFCSNACRQWAYRQRVTTGTKIEPSEPVAEHVIHLDEVAGVLHYRGTPIIAITGLYRSWQGFGNRHVSNFPIPGSQALYKVFQAAQGWMPRDDHIFECLECRRWSVGAGWVFCSRQCRLAHRAEATRDRRADARQRAP
jgi:hypothetical protein